jgi:hypothetical protein
MPDTVKTGLRAGGAGRQSSLLSLTLNCLVAGFAVGILVASLLACITLLIAGAP